MEKSISILNQNGQLVVTSRQIAEDFEKQHKDVLETIRTIINQMSTAENCALYFIPSKYKASNGKTNPEYLLTRDGFSLLVMGFTGSKALEWKMKYIEAFNKMEQELKPTSIEDLIIMQAQNMKNIREKMNKVESQTQLLSNRVSNLDCIGIEGTPRQRLNAIVKKYSFVNGINIGIAWNEFVKRYNTAFSSNLTARKKNYLKKNNLKSLTTPEFLEKNGLIEDALRIADKMINVRG